MNKFFKWVLAMVATVAVVLVILSFALPLLLDPNNYKEEINAAVLKETGRELTIAGDISWRIFPSVGLDIEQLSLANRPGFGVRSMLEVAEASVSVELLPLFSRQLEIGRIDLEGFRAYLRSNNDGQNNWEDLLGEAAAVTQEMPAEMEIDIRGGNISLDNTARQVALDGFDTGSMAGTPTQAFELRGRLELEFLQQQLTGTVDFEGLIQALRGQGLVALQGVALSFNGSKGSVDGKAPLAFETGADVIVDLHRDEAALTGLTLQLFDLNATGTLNISQLSSEFEYDGQLQVAEFSPRQLLQDLGLEVPQTQDAEVLGKMQAELGFGGSATRVDITDLKVVLDRSALEGQLAVVAFEPLQLSFDLAIDTLNLDDYSLVAETQDSAEVGGAGLALGSMLYFAGGGDLRIDHFVTGGLTAEDFKVTIHSDANEIRLFPMSSRFYGGQQQGDIKLDISSAQPTLRVNQVVTGFETAALLKDLAGIDRLHGKGDVYLQVHTRLGSAELTRSSLTGDIGLSVVDGVIDDIDVRSAVDKVTALLGQDDGSPAGIETPDRMEFAELTISGIIEKGILKSDDLVLRSALVNASGKGSVNLVNETISYVLYPVLVNELAAQVPQEYRGLSVPVRLSGRLFEPDVSLDIAAGTLAPRNADIVNKAGEAASSLLEGLLGNKKDKPKKKGG